MGNRNSNLMMNSLNDLDENTIINQGTPEYRHPQLAFHTVHGMNVQLQKSNRIAKRHESFCKGLAFSNRPIAIDEIVCLKLCEVSTNWSGVLRFGVTNVDPEAYRYTVVPKFACPDLTSKEGYWAKALPERYSVEGHILHFFVNVDGELHYGINGTNKGLFLTGIDVDQPMWVIVDIYGNSQAVEFIDASEHRPRRHRHLTPTVALPVQAPPPVPPPPAIPTITNNSTENYASANIAFHRVVGRHITLSAGRSIATRSEQEYSHGYVFTERPIANNEKITIQITKVVDLYHGGIAIGLTCRDPATLRGAELPADSSDLVNFPEMFVGIKDVANKPPAGTKLSFWVTDKAELKMQYNDREPRTLIFVDNSLQLYFYFDVYGSTQAIRLMGANTIAPRSRSPAMRSADQPSSSRMDPSLHQTHVALPRRENGAEPTSSSISMRLESSMGSMRLSDERPPVPTRRTNSIIEDLLTGPSNSVTPSSLPPPLAPSGGSRMSPRPPPVTPRPASTSISSASELFGSATPSRPPVAPPVSTIPSLPRRPPAPLPTTVALPSSAPPPSVPPPSRTSFLFAPPVLHSSASAPGMGGMGGEEGEECSVCMSAPINSVIYTCGHMCMCYTCAVQTKELGHGCPICRQPMQDVIRTYKSGTG